ncbi:MAG: glucosamine-6-phosphate deaminase [Acidobacteriota bacterium]
MEIIIQPSEREATELAAQRIVRLLRARPDAVLGLATGRSPQGVYDELARCHDEDGLDFSRATTFNLDEYVGVAPDHPGSFHRAMRDSLFDHVNLDPARTHLPDGLVADIPTHCEAYERAIVDAGGIDLQLLGIGADGHIGFNEPSSSLSSRTRIKTLTEQTRRDNAATFAGAEMPRHVITMGIGTIMDTREVVLLAFGERKARAVARALEGPITASVPASILQMHPATKVILDEAAAIRLERAAYYRSVYAGKPDWQR